MELGMRDRVVLVTGASSGIGRATACAYAREGARVALTCHRNRDGAEQTAGQARAAGRGAAAVAAQTALGDGTVTREEGWKIAIAAVAAVGVLLVRNDPAPPPAGTRWPPASSSLSVPS